MAYFDFDFVQWHCWLSSKNPLGMWTGNRLNQSQNWFNGEFTRFFFFLQICQVSTECMVPHVFFPHQPDHPDPNYGRGKSWGWIAAAPRWIHQWWPGAVYTGLMAISIKEGWTWGFSTLGFMEWVPDFQFLEIWYSINPVLEIPWNKWSQCISRKSAWTSRRALTCTATMSLRPLKETWVAVLFGESMLGW